MRYVDLLQNTLWSEQDIATRGREIINAQVTEARQNELRTIMLGHIAQMRAATAEEMAEIGLVQTLTEGVVASNEAARADMALLNATMEFERARDFLNKPPEPELIDDQPNPLYEQDVANRASAQAVVDAATKEVQALYTLRNPVVEVLDEKAA